MAISKATKAALKALSYPDPDIKKSYKKVRKIEKLMKKRLKNPKATRVSTAFVERGEHKIPVKIFTPAEELPKGVILFFHGGGWVNGDIETYSAVCADIQQQLHRTVVSVDYRRAPEYKFPAAPEDCYAAAKALFEGRLISGFIPDDIILMGDSAGGNLAAAVSLMARDRGEFSVKRQILIYPAVSGDHSETSPFESVRENGTDYLLTSKRVRGYMELYISGEADLKNPYLAPLEAEDFRAMPDTLIITAQYCPLRDEGEEYGKRLFDAGNNAYVYRMPDALHGYFTLPVKFRPQKKTYAVIRRFLGDGNESAVPHATSWTKLDNAAKIFPPTVSNRDSKVFRLFCEFNEKVEPRALQAALDAAMESFPFYRAVLKQGVFWYYLESTDIKPAVREEYREPCPRLYDKNRKALLFEVTYFKNRVNFEVFHALTDGEGAARFMQTLVTAYLKKRYFRDLGHIPEYSYDATAAEKQDDSFFRYYKDRSVPKTPAIKRAYHIRGARLAAHPLAVIEGEMPVAELLKTAHQYNTTLTAFLVSLYLKVMDESLALRDRGKTAVIDVPVDLRQFFQSKSARNFFGIIRVEYTFAEQPRALEEIIPAVSLCMKNGLDKTKISERMTGLSKMENFLPARIVPLIIKNPVLRAANSFADRGVTAAFSNLGRIELPEEAAAYVRKIGVMSSTKRMQACMCSSGGRFVITFTSPFASTELQCRFFRGLAGMGIPVEITSNLGRDKDVIL